MAEELSDVEKLGTVVVELQEIVRKMERRIVDLEGRFGELVDVVNKNAEDGGVMNDVLQSFVKRIGNLEREGGKR